MFAAIINHIVADFEGNRLRLIPDGLISHQSIPLTNKIQDQHATGI